MVKFLRAKLWSGDTKRMAESEAMVTEGRAPLASGEITESPALGIQMMGTVSEFTRGKEYKVRAVTGRQRTALSFENLILFN